MDSSSKLHKAIAKNKSDFQKQQMQLSQSQNNGITAGKKLDITCILVPRWESKWGYEEEKLQKDLLQGDDIRSWRYSIVPRDRDH
jgi:hypothetical protein